MGAIDLVKTLIAEGVTFETDGQRLRWKSEAGPLPEEVVSELRASKGDVLAFLAGTKQAGPTILPFPRSRAANIQRLPHHPNPVRSIVHELEGDLEAYTEALRLHGPMSYGQAMDVLGWGATRAGIAETHLRKAGKITFNKHGRAVLVDQEADNHD